MKFKTQFIIEKLKELNWSQQNLADDLCLSQSVVSKLINNKVKEITVSHILRIAEILKVKPDEIITHEKGVHIIIMNQNVDINNLNAKQTLVINLCNSILGIIKASLIAEYANDI